MKVSNKLLTAILTVALGVMFIILKGEVVSIAMTVLGVALLVAAVIDLVNKQVPPAIVKGVMGAAVILFGWLFVSLALYVMAAVLLIYGLLIVYELAKAKTKKVLSYVGPVIMIVAAICLLFAQGNAVNLMFIISGAFLIVEGVLMLVDALKK